MSLETFKQHITSIDDLEAVIGLPTHREKCRKHSVFWLTSPGKVNCPSQ